ncbi:MAG: HEPN domain-containing protein [Acidobacteriota bacterium]
MLRKTDSINPVDWLFIAESDIEALQVCAEREVGYSMCRSKLAEVVEKLMKAELLRLGWLLVRTHDLEALSGELRARGSDLVAQLDPLCDALTDAYFTDRYPGFDISVPPFLPAACRSLGSG